MPTPPSSPSPSTDAVQASSPDRLARLSIDTVRTLAIDAVQRANSGHPGAPMGLAPLAYALWSRVLKYDGARPDWADRDRFVLSCGHASMLLYAMLYLTGQELTLDDLRNFRQWGSLTAGHPEHELLAGVETTTGPLGQGIATAVGMALAERILATRFNRPGHEVVDHRTWVIASDGDMMEGVSYEAASLAGHLALDRLCVFYDANRITIDGKIDVSFTEDVGARFAACGWHVLHVGDDATTDAYVAAADAARADTGRPTLVVCRTHIGWGSPNKQDSSSAHGAPLGEEEVRLTKRNLGWPEDADFLVPDEVYEHLQACGARGAAAAQAWDREVEAYRSELPAEAELFDRALRGELAARWTAALPTFESGTKMATRKASGVVLNAIKDAVPELVGGSADLAGSNNTDLKGEDTIGPASHGGRILHYGVREHAMGAALNGMALHGGIRPYAGTFLVFSDYMRPAIRLAALMRLPVVYVFTHDSIGVGEDGPTHQPVEHVAALRSIPGLKVLRPADGAETAEAWRIALETDGPAALVLTRQKLPELDRGAGALAPATGTSQGGYVLAGAEGDADVVLLASGSEVHLALAAAAELREQDGLRTRVVSMPCWELFEALSEDEREAVLGRSGVRVAVEAGVAQGWHRWIGSDGATVTMDRFGASAPGDRLMVEFGFTPANVAAVARAAHARRPT